MHSHVRSSSMKSPQTFSFGIGFAYLLTPPFLAQNRSLCSHPLVELSTDAIIRCCAPFTQCQPVGRRSLSSTTSTVTEKTPHCRQLPPTKTPPRTPAAPVRPQSSLLQYWCTAVDQAAPLSTAVVQPAMAHLPYFVASHAA
jgi:hypothetical protein